jgi:hypothetical protein
MRALRTLAGLVLVLIGFPAIIAGAAGMIALQHRDADGAFTTELAPLHADGYAIVVPDVDTAVNRYGLAPLLGSGRLTVTLRDSAEPVVLAFAKAEPVKPYLAGVAHSELTSVGYADGTAPVTLVAQDGVRAPAPAHNQDFWLAVSQQTLDWQPAAGESTLVILRVDGRAGIDATLAVSRYPTGLRTMTLALLLVGVVGLAGGVVLLFLAAEPMVVVEEQRMEQLADQIADRIEFHLPGPAQPTVGAPPRPHDLTGELVLPYPPEPPWSAPYGGNHAGGFHSGHRPPHTPVELADRWRDDDVDDPGSSYVHTAT